MPEDDGVKETDMTAPVIHGASPLVKIEGVSHVYRAGFWMRPIRALDGVSFEVPKGSVFGFVGPNGAGKTTLIHLITGIRKATEGRVTVAGFPAVSRLAKRRVGYLPERPYFHDHLQGRELLRYFAALGGMDTFGLEARIDETLARVGLSGDASRRELRTYSKGMLQRIGIAQAILHGPELLVLDEPMSGLDPAARREIRDLIRSLGREGRTVFFSTHVLSDLEAVCDHAALLRGGKLVASGTFDELSRRVRDSANEETHYEVRLQRSEGRATAWLPGSGVPVHEASGGMLLLDVPESRLSAMLDSALRAGLSVRGIQPAKSPIEQLLNSSRELHSEGRRELQAEGRKDGLG
jgi:ABC-2 type transport system ATP-binding protein